MMTKKNMGRWWRAYESGLHDPKLQSLPPRLFKFWFNLLCLASRKEHGTFTLGDVKATLRCRLDVAKVFLNALQEASLIDACEGGWIPHNWSERQYKSDLSTERVQRYRNVSGNVSETPPDTETETETEKKDALTRELPPPAAAGSPALAGAAVVQLAERRQQHSSAAGRRAARKTAIAPDFCLEPSTIAWAEKNGLSGERLEREVASFKARCAAKGYAYVDWQAGFRSQMTSQFGPLANGPLKKKSEGLENFI